MATGDRSDMVSRLQSLLPQGWFPTTLSDAPILNGVLNGFAAGFAQSYSLISFALSAVLLSTAQNIFLDIKAQDFLGNTVLRRPGETDTSFRARSTASIFPAAVTRKAVINRVELLTGITPTVFEPSQPIDTGVYCGVHATNTNFVQSPITVNGSPLTTTSGSVISATLFGAASVLPGYYTAAYNKSGGYGSLALPFQAFIKATLPPVSGSPYLAGYDGNKTSPVYAPWGYGTGLGAYLDIDQNQTALLEEDIYQAIEDAAPAGSIMWTAITT